MNELATDKTGEIRTVKHNYICIFYCIIYCNMFWLFKKKVIRPCKIFKKDYYIQHNKMFLLNVVEI